MTRTLEVTLDVTPDSPIAVRFLDLESGDRKSYRFDTFDFEEMCFPLKRYKSKIIAETGGEILSWLELMMDEFRDEYRESSR